LTGIRQKERGRWPGGQCGKEGKVLGKGTERKGTNIKIVLRCGREKMLHRNPGLPLGKKEDIEQAEICIRTRKKETSSLTRGKKNLGERERETQGKAEEGETVGFRENFLRGTC